MCVILTTRHPSQADKELVLTAGGKIPYWLSSTEAYNVAPPKYVALEAQSVDDMAQYLNAPAESFVLGV